MAVTGISTWAQYDATATATSPATAYGRGVTDGSFTEGVEPERIEYMGPTGAVLPGYIDLKGSVTFDVNHSAPLLYALRDTSAIPAFTHLHCDGNTSRVYKNCQVNSMRLSQSGINANLQATLEIWGLTKPVVGAVGTAAANTLAAYHFQDAVITLGGVAICVKSFEITVNNQLQYDRCPIAHTATEKRFWDSIALGSEDISLSVTAATPLTDAVQKHLADDASFDIVFSAVYTKGTRALTLGLSGMTAQVREMPGATGSQMVEYTISLLLPYNAGGVDSALTLTEVTS